MRYLIAPIMIGTLVVAAAAAPAAAQTKPGQGATVRLAMTHDPATERVSYIQKTRDEIGVWQQKLQDFGTKVGTRTTAARAKATKDLDSAWAETKSAADRLESASSEDWDSAKTTYRQAIHKLALAWHKVNPKAT